MRICPARDAAVAGGGAPVSAGGSGTRARSGVSPPSVGISTSSSSFSPKRWRPCGSSILWGSNRRRPPTSSASPERPSGATSMWRGRRSPMPLCMERRSGSPGAIVNGWRGARGMGVPVSRPVTGPDGRRPNLFRQGVTPEPPSRRDDGHLRLIHPHTAQPVAVLIKRLVDDGVLHPPGFDTLSHGAFALAQGGGFPRLYLDEDDILHLVGIGQPVKDDEIDRGPEEPCILRVVGEVREVRDEALRDLPPGHRLAAFHRIGADIPFFI